MASYERMNSNDHENDEQQPMSNEEVAAAQNVETNPSDEDISDVLDEIDGVLESNAEEFVRNYVQKGGQ
jgi:ubiquitin-like protein Pup